MSTDAVLESGGDRKRALDVLRGFALFGILLMNVPGYGLISASYVNPVAQGELATGDWLAWAFTHVFVEQKFMTLFSLLFGVGILMAAERRVASDLSPWPAFLRRSGMLLLLGLAHAYLIWYGDVLTTYVLAGVLAMAMRKSKVKTLLVVGTALLALPSLYSILLGLSYESFPQEIKRDLAMAWTPGVEAVAQERAAYLSGWLGQMPRRISDALTLETLFMATVFFWRAAGLMLIGMALYRLGFMDASRSSGEFRRLSLLTLPLGFALVAIGIVSNEIYDWHVSFSMFLGNQFNYWGSVLIAIGYLAVVSLLIRSQRLPGVVSVLAKTGKMTLTLYLLMSVLGTFLFYGHGFGYYDQLGRMTLLLITPVFWAIELFIVAIWLRRFKHGPAEALMRWSSQGRLRSSGKEASYQKPAFTGESA
jgi:uncharacterized protein